jgi:hypothetical protein
MDVSQDKHGPEAEIWTVTSPLSTWAGEPRGRTLDDMLASGNDVISSLASSYADVALADIALLAGLIAAMRGAPGRADELRAEMMRVGLALKGQAGTMGYPLLTEVATSLTDFLDVLRTCARRDADDPPTLLAALQAHVEALCRLMARGDTAGEETARAMVERLGRVAAAALPACRDNARSRHRCGDGVDRGPSSP